MFRTLSEMQKGATFYAITLGLAVLLALFGPTGSDAIQTINMFTATAGVLLMLLVVTPDGYHRAGWAQLGLHRAGFRYWPLALLAPMAVLVASYAAATLLGAVSWRFESDTVINLAINIVIISFFAFFEEIGWRGYLLPKLETGYPQLAPALVGFLHGVWHLPLMLLTTAYNPAGNRLIVVPLFLAVLTVAGILYGYLRNASGSLWPVVIAHGTFNAVLGVLAGAAVVANPTTAAYLTGETGVFTLLALMIVAWILTRRSAVREEDHLVAQTEPWGRPGLPQYPDRVLHGRAGELAAVNRLLERAREGYSGAVVVRGEAGIGKSALLEYAAAQASGFTVLRATGIESEAEFAFATLHQLLRPAQDGIDQLPPPQASGLRAAFGLAPLSADGDQRFLVAVAALTLLTDTAEQQPVLCLIDDAHWADRSSTDVLLFVARRLAAEGVVLIFAARDGTPKTFGDFQSPGVAELTLGGLDVEAAACLTPDAIIPSVLAEVVTRTGGNPLVLREVLPQLDSDQRAGRAPLPATLPIGKRMEQAFLGRVRPLPATTQELLEIIAADETGDLPTALRVASFLTGSGDAAALALAEDAGLIRIQAGRVEFRHPLLRTAVYRGMPAQRRRTIHWALADVLGDTAPDRRSWHLATASDAPDEAVAAALEDSAERARARSGYAAAATALERAADLSPGDAARVRRLAAAADNAWLAGQGPRAQALVRRAAPLAQEASQRAALGYLDGMFQLRTGVAADAVDTLLKAADLAAVHDPSLALRMLMAASDAANYAGEPARLVDLARRAAALPAPRDDRGWFAVHFLTGLSCVFEGDLDRGTELLEAADTLADSFDEPAYLLWAASTGLYTGRGDSRRLVPRAVARARALGAVGTLPHALEFASLGSAMAGYVTQAITQASEGLQLARDIGQEAPACNLLAALATATALQGREQDCKTYADEALVEAVPRRLGLSIGLATRALGLLDLGLGRPAEALERFESIWSAEPGGGHPFVAITSAQDLVESAVRAGRPDIAAAAVSVMAARSQRAGPAQRGMLAYSQGLVAEAAEAAPHFEEALWLFPPQPMPFWRARIQLGYGEQLRRARHRSEARGHLRAALETFERLGAEPWAERARAELRATGETARRRDVVAVHELTPQELQIAGYASQGASNPEIAAQLFLSRRTVEYHLSKVFQKLGVSSRTELAALEQR